MKKSHECDDVEEGAGMEEEDLREMKAASRVLGYCHLTKNRKEKENMNKI